MAFLLRNISLSAEGREIVRTSRVRDDLIKVGRDPDNDIVLNDLAVALHHATLEQISASQIGVSAEAGLTVEIDGVTTQGGQINTVSGGTIKVGPFLLRILAAEMGSEDVAIDVARADTDADEEKFDTRRFALATTLPGKRTLAWSLAVVVLGLFLAWPIYSYWSQRDAHARSRSRPAIMPIGCGAAARCRAAMPASRTIAPPATRGRSNRCAIPPAPPATPRCTTMPICSRMQQAGPELGAWASLPARRRQCLRPDSGPLRRLPYRA